MTYLVIKCGGSMLEELPRSFYDNIVTLINEHGLKPVIVHGGGPMISSLLTDLKIEAPFVDGMRTTTEDVLDIAEMVLSGSANKQIVRNIQVSGGHALGLSGVDGGLLEARPLTEKQALGFVGDVESVQTGLLSTLLAQGHIPVISPIAASDNGQRWNINADLAAAAIANALEASLYMITDVAGVMQNDQVMSHLDKQAADNMLAQGDIYGGMIPKVQAGLTCLQKGVKQVVILNGLEPDSLLKAARGGTIGTSLTLGQEQTMNI